MLPKGIFSNFLKIDERVSADALCYSHLYLRYFYTFDRMESVLFLCLSVSEILFLNSLIKNPVSKKETSKFCVKISTN